VRLRAADRLGRARRTVLTRGARLRRARRAGSLPSGWITGPPDFVGVGVQRCGTTWWYEVIAAHPEVEGPADEKELHFFDAFWKEPFTDESSAEYAALFPRAEGRLCGEWTPRYLYDVWTPPLLARAAPEARLLVLLRDPVERFRSGLAYELLLAPGSADAASRAFARGLYHAQLQWLLRFVDRARVLVLQYERCRSAPESELRRTYEFLGVRDPGFVPASLHRPGNVTAAPKTLLPTSLLEALGAAYRPDAERLFAAFPELDPELWTTLALG
jgi:Sulfotransferase domain